MYVVIVVFYKVKFIKNILIVTACSSKVHFQNILLLLKHIITLKKDDLKMNRYSKVLLRFAALFALLGAFIGSHMAGAGSYKFQSVHAHILVVGWLTLLGWALFYKVFSPRPSLLTTLHVYTGIIGSVGLTLGMWLYNVNPFNMEGALPLIVFIAGGTILLISFILFAILTFTRLDTSE